MPFEKGMTTPGSKTLKDMVIIEVGKTYEARDVEYCKQYGFPFRVKIVSRKWNYPRQCWIYTGHDSKGSRYYEDGRFCNSRGESPYDLIHEVKQ